MDDYELSSSLDVVKESLSRMVNSPGVYVQFSSTPAGMNPLKDALYDVLTKVNKLTQEELEKERAKDKKEADDAAEKHNKELAAAIKGIVDKKEQHDKDNAGSIADMGRKAWKEIQNGNGKSMAWGNKMLGYATAGVTVGKELYGVAKQIYTKIMNLVATNVDFASELRESGVLIKEGFDEGFIKYANEAGKTREGFIELARENSKLISSVNASGLNGAELLSKESKKLTGTLGMSAKEVNSSVKYYNDTMMTAANQANISSADHETNLMRTTKALKMFAFETGQSYESLLKERKEREKTWQMQRLASDPRTQAQFRMLRNMGMSDDQIEAIMLGKANKASVMAHMDADSGALFDSLQMAYRNSKGDPEAFSRSLGKLSNSASANRLREKSANINVEDYAYMSESMGNIIDPSQQYGKLLSQTFQQDAEKYMYDQDADALNTVQEGYAQINAVNNTLKDSIAPNLKTIADWFPSITKSATWMAEMLKDHPILGKIAGALSITGMMAKTFAESFLPYLLFSKLGGGLGAIGKKIFGGGLPKVLSGLKSIGGKFITKMGSAFKWGTSLFSKSFSAMKPLFSGFLTKMGSVFKLGGSAISKVVGGVAGKVLGPLGLAFEGYNTYKDFKSGNKAGGWGSVAGGAIGGLLGLIGGPAGAMLGASLGSAAGRWIGNTFFGDKNAPANAESTSQYNTNSQEQTEEKEEDSGKIAAAYNSISVNGMGNIESLLISINNNTRSLVNELRNSGFQVGTNLAT